MTDAELDALCRKLRSYYEGPKPKPIPPITDEAADAIAALREQIIELRENIKALDNSLSEANIKRGDAEADNAALRKDAERYRYLRNPPSELVAVEAYIGGGKWAFIEGEQVDVTVDAALLAGKKP